jgi:hypothetical protein
MTLQRRLQDIEGRREAVLREIEALGERAAGVRYALVKERLNRLEEAAEGPLDRREVNGLLRQLLEKVTVDYPNGRLLLAWRRGGETGAFHVAEGCRVR